MTTMGSCLTCFKAPPNPTAGNVGVCGGAVSGPDAAVIDPDVAVHGRFGLICHRRAEFIVSFLF